MQHVSFFLAPLVLGALILAGCQTTQEAAKPASTSTAPKQWVGTWSGAWLDGGQCPSTITVKEVDGTQAVATYTWGRGCGGNDPGSYTDQNAKILGNTLKIVVPDYNFGARYTMRDDGNLNGVWATLAGKHTTRATFNRK